MLETSSPSTTSPFAQDGARVTYGALLAKTMFLVAGAIGLLTLGAVIGRDYDYGIARVLSFVGFGMLIAQSFVGALRYGTIGLAWLGGLAFVIGLGLGPFLASYVAVNPDGVAEAAGMTAVITLGAGAVGTLTSHDLARWMRPLSLIVFVAALGSWIFLAVGSGGSPILSAIIGIVSALLIVVDFNFLRRRATDADVIWIATGIFVSVINIFLSLLSLGRD